jgi:uncharacterized protein (DUF305 family)
MAERKRYDSKARHAEHTSWRNIAPLTIAFVAVLVAGVSLAMFATSRPPGDDSPEAGFARDMMIHHAQAVQTAEIVRDRTENEQIRALAQQITLAQRAEIGHMQGWLAAWGLQSARDEPAMSWMGHPTEGDMPGMATPEELNRLMEAPPKEADTLFLLLMIPHHKGAIPMIEAVLERTDRPEVRRLAEYMAASQRQEIALMRSMLRQEDMAPVAISLRSAGDSEVSATASFEGNERGVKVELEVRNLAEANAAYLAHIHPGSCVTGDHEHGENHGHAGADDEIEYPLSPVKPDGRGNGASTTMLQGVTLEQLFSEGPTYFNVHAAGSAEATQLACANLSEA